MKLGNASFLSRLATPAAIVATAVTMVMTIAGPARAADACQAQSGPATAALVELYTSEGCSSCPPADAALSALRPLAANGRIVPLALHVTYWDAIGWRDPFGQPAFDQRQRQLAALRKTRVVYTPQFFVGGVELRNWQSRLAQAVADTNAIPAGARIHLASQPAGENRLSMQVESQLFDASRHAGSQLQVAITESGVVSRVLRGENGGTTLRHDHAVRLWLAPVIADAQGQARFKQVLDLPSGWQRKQLQAVAFVQAADGRVLQALSAPVCVAES